MKSSVFVSKIVSFDALGSWLPMSAHRQQHRRCTQKSIMPFVNVAGPLRPSVQCSTVSFVSFFKENKNKSQKKNRHHLLDTHRHTLGTENVSVHQLQLISSLSCSVPHVVEYSGLLWRHRSKAVGLPHSCPPSDKWCLKVFGEKRPTDKKRWRDPIEGVTQLIAKVECLGCVYICVCVASELVWCVL